MIKGGGSPTREVYILGISTYGGFEPTSATLDYLEAEKWVQNPTQFVGPDTMHVYRRIEFEL